MKVKKCGTHRYGNARDPLESEGKSRRGYLPVRVGKFVVNDAVWCIFIIVVGAFFTAVVDFFLGRIVGAEILVQRPLRFGVRKIVL